MAITYRLVKGSELTYAELDGNFSDLAGRFTSVTDYGATGDGTTDDTDAIQAAIDALSANNGGTLYLPAGTYAISSTLSVNTSNISIVGDGADIRHIANPQFIFAATILKWIGASGGSMIEFSSPSGASNNKCNGGGISGIAFNANSLAGYGLTIKSWNSALFQRLQFHEFLTSALTLDVVADLNDTESTQNNIFRQFRIWQSVQTGYCLWMKASTAGVNVSYNIFEQMTFQHKNGVGINMENGDSNYFVQTRVIRTTGGTADSIVLHGSDVDAAYVARANVFDHLMYTTLVSKGTASYTYPAYGNSLTNLDSSNGVALPTIEAGSYVGNISYLDGRENVTTLVSAATVDLGTAATYRVFISGNTTISSFGTAPRRIKHIKFATSLVITHNATTLYCPGGADITTLTGDTCIAMSNDDGEWEIVSYTRKGTAP